MKKCNFSFVFIGLFICSTDFIIACREKNQVISDSEANDYPASPGLSFISNVAESNNLPIPPLAKDFYKTQNSALSATNGLYDLTDNAKMSINATLDIRTSEATRKNIVGKLSLRDITADPGNTFIRNKDELVEHAKAIKLSGKPQQKIILNIITDNSNGIGKVMAVDAWTGTEELVAMLNSGYDTIEKLPQNNVTILVNGCTAGKSECWKHWIRASGADMHLNFKENKPSFNFKVLTDQKGSIEVDGVLSNFKLGSRTSVGQLEKNLDRPKPKISVAIITADPPHMGHFGLSNYSLTQEGVEEAVVLVNGAEHKQQASSFIHRSNMTALLSESIPKINPVQTMYTNFDETFGRDALLERLENAYGTDKILVLEGQDAYERNLVNLGGQLESKKGVYVVFKRGDAGAIKVPDTLKMRVKIAQTDDVAQLSSTLIRNALKAGNAIKEAWINIKVAKYIEQYKLFGATVVKLIK